MSDLIPTVSLVSGRPATTSLAIAEHFEKPHKDVLESIRKLITECPQDFTERNFPPSEYTDSTGRNLPMYHVFFDGFMLLVMGYTGKKALAMKLAYIAAFNAMREKLEAEKAQKPLRNRQASLPGKDKYEAYIEEVEAFRAKTAAEIKTLLRKGLALVNVRKFGPDGIIGFTTILLDWLQGVAGRHDPLVSAWNPMDRAIESSPLCLMKRMEEWLPNLRK